MLTYFVHGFPSHPPTRHPPRSALFPAWLLPLFKALLGRPFPTFSNVMNAWATAFTCQWLMGPCKVTEAKVDSGETLAGHGVQIERCRFLEEAGCAAVCVNCCKVPTQDFFINHMGVNVTLEPNYDDFSCKFSFGKTPVPQDQDPAFSSACFSICPSKKPARQQGANCHNVAADPAR
jgi:hypothetical protein